VIKTMKKLFGTNGVRGIANVDMTPDMALVLGKSLGTYMQRHNVGSSVAVGRDTRISGDMLKSAAIAGLLSAGMKVIDVGVLPIPALQYYVRDRADAGIMITASHNPREYNGLKIVAGDGTEFSRQGEADVETIYHSGEFHIAQWNETGNFYRDSTPLRTYMDGIISNVDAEAIRSAGLTVVVDPGCGASCEVTPMLLRELGCKVISLNAQPDGTFPGRAPEPTRDVLSNLMNTVKAAGAALGVAHDGDADRVAFVDETGEFLDEEDLLAIMAGYVLQLKKGTVVTPISSSLKIKDMTESMGGKLIWTRVGSIDVARKMIETRAVFGGEGNGGLIFPEFQYCRDGAMTAAKMLETLAGGKKLTELRAGIPEYHNIKTKVACSSPGEVIKKVKQALEGKNVDDTDGLKIWCPDGWILIRPSGTEPIIRIYAESKSIDRMNELMEYGSALVNECNIRLEAQG
jgi:phosphomannomutase/phosphoglucomutase